jgi:hypothetical protein
MKRRETRAVSRETRAWIFAVLRFMLFEGPVIGKRDLKRAFVSRFMGIGVKCETKVDLMKRA